MHILPRLLCFATLGVLLLNAQNSAVAATRQMTFDNRVVAPKGSMNADSVLGTWHTLKPSAPKFNHEKEAGDIMATIAFILGIASLVTVFNLYALLIAPVGILISIIALINIRKHPEKKKAKKQAIIALILNSVGLLLGLSLLGYFINWVFD